MASPEEEINYSKIDNLSPNNNFTENEKRNLDTLIKLIEKDNGQTSLFQRITQGILFIGVCKNDIGLCDWSLKNGSDPGKVLDWRTLNIIRMSGFIIPELEEVFSNQSVGSNNNSLDLSIIASLNTFKVGTDILSENCVICKDKYKEEEFIIKLNCNHIFHKKCLVKWFEKDNTCPLCRNIVK
tara:strand:+ start:87 stop:635 length:549 start_codon:yes stop_codon:yes gene_type:complete